MRTYTKTWASIDTEYGEFELDGNPVDDNAYEAIVDGNHAAVGYMVHDRHPINPLEDSDSYGGIYSSHRDRWDDHRPMQEALGLNSDWHPNIDQFEDQACQIMIERALKDVIAKKYPKVRNISVDHDTDDFSEGTVLLYYHNTRKTFPYETDYHPIDGTWKWILAFQGTETHLGDWEDIATELWKEGRKNGTVGDPYAVSLDVYDHSGVVYSVMRTSVYSIDPWDNARGGAVWVPSECLRKEEIASLPEDQRRGRCIELAKQAAEVYTDWSNGRVYGIIVELFFRESEDHAWVRVEDADTNEYEASCSGLYGWNNALKEAKQMAENGLKYLKEKHNDKHNTNHTN